MSGRRLTQIALALLAEISFSSCRSTPVHVLEFPAAFEGSAIIVWAQPGYPPLPSEDHKLIFRFPSDGVLITSTAQSRSSFKERVFYVDASGSRTPAKPTPRVERFDGVESRGKNKLNHTLLFVGGSGPANHVVFEEANRKVSEIFSRLYAASAEPGAVESPDQQSSDSITIGRAGHPQGNGPGGKEISGAAFLLVLLLPYALVILFGGWWFLRKGHREYRLAHPHRHRVYLAVYLAVVFTPSVITDFWLFMIPGPAFVGFSLLAPALLVPEHRSLVLYATGLYHILPMITGFGVCYLLLWAHSRFRSRRLARNI